MKIAISSNGGNLNSTLDGRFGRCNNFVIYDTENKQAITIKNKGQTSESGAGIAATQQIIDDGVDAVITGHLGPNAYKLFKNSGIKVYQCENIPITEAIQLFQQGKLDEITEAGPAHAGADTGK